MGIIRKPITPEERLEVEDEIKQEPIGGKTLCNHVRFIYQIAMRDIQNEELKNSIVSHCKTIMVYAKRMDWKLKVYNKGDYEI